jgi:hypothetical protein
MRVSDKGYINIDKYTMILMYQKPSGGGLGSYISLTLSPVKYLHHSCKPTGHIYVC